MDSRIQQLIDMTKIKFGLHHYYLRSHKFDRSINIFNETIYTLSMEWFPNHVTVQEDDDLNPEGAAIIEISLNNRKFKSAIFVMGKSYAEDGIMFANHNNEDIIKWIEDETGLKYGEQFQLHKEDDGKVHFKECINDVDVSPSGSIEVNFDKGGKLTFFAVHGQFPSAEVVKEETYLLSLEKLKDMAKEQVKLVEYPSFDHKKLFSVYAVEEVYITNDRMEMIPYEIFADVRSYLKINKIMYWDKPINGAFDRKELDWIEDVSAAQVFSCEPSPDIFPISGIEQEKCVMAVNDHLRQEYPKDSGNWILKTLHRDKRYIQAILKANKQDNRVFQRKLVIMIDANSLQVVNYIDNKPMLEIFDQFQASEKVTVNQEEAFEKLKGLLEHKPYYVYDFEQKQYVLCGKLDCNYGVNASTGEVVALHELASY